MLSFFALWDKRTNRTEDTLDNKTMGKIASISRMWDKKTTEQEQKLDGVGPVDNRPSPD